MFPSELCHLTDGTAGRFLFVRGWHLSGDVIQLTRFTRGTVFSPSSFLHESNGGAAARVTQLEFITETFEKTLLPPCAEESLLVSWNMTLSQSQYTPLPIPLSLVLCVHAMVKGSRWDKGAGCSVAPLSTGFLETHYKLRVELSFQCIMAIF